MARPLWSGTIQISLVGFAVEIYPATSTTRPFTFHEIDRNTLARVRRANVSDGPAPDGESAEEAAPDSQKNTATLHLASQAKEIEAAGMRQEPLQHSVDRANIVKGYEYEKGKYAIVEPEELKNLRLAGKKTIEISQFAKASEVDPILYEKPYFVMPKAGPQAVAFSVMRQSMTESGMVGVGEIVFSGRQHLMTLAPPHDPHQPGMMLYTLRFATELRDARDLQNGAEAVKADAAQLRLAKQLVDAYTQPFVVNDFKDHYEEALRELVEAKIKNLPIPEHEVEKKPPQVVDLMEALRLSLSRRSPASPVAETTDARPSAKSRGGKNSAKDKPANVVARSASGKKAKTA
jgi:DNA end-binding protein Ku